MYYLLSLVLEVGDRKIKRILFSRGRFKRLPGEGNS